MPVQAPVDGERKTITALFADIKGSMELMEDLDPEEARAIIDPALQLMMDAVRHYGGHVAQSTGDGIFALFGAPVAHEDHPQRALYAALRMQQGMARYGGRLRLEKGVDLKARVGINTGEVVVRSVQKDESHADYLPVGHSTGLAQRMQTLSAPGAIVVTEHTRKLVEGYFQLKALGPTKVKGLTEPIEVYEVVGLGPLRTRLQLSAHRGLSRFIGREVEMAVLRKALEQAKAGQGQIVAVSGAPGLGKSRLFYEFKLRSGTGCRVLEAFSVSHGKAAAYLPVIELLKSYFEIAGDDDERRRLEKVNGKVITLDRSLEGLLPALYPLLGVYSPNSDTGQDDADAPLSPLEGGDAQGARRRTIEAIKRLLLRESLNQPLIVIFEDLHWVDSETQALLEVLVESIATAQVLLLVNYRPEYRHQRSGRSYYSQVALEPLGGESAAAMLTALLGNHSSVTPLKTLIAQKTEGNPFFMEEIVQTLIEEGALKRDGEMVLTRPIARVQIPASVKGILAARIDRLSKSEKDLLQTAAVIGRTFTLAILSPVVSKPPEQLEPLLANLQNAEFIYEGPPVLAKYAGGSPASGINTALSEADYLFKHALTQEVAYGSLLIERRKILHERTAEAIESLHRERLEDHYGDLAHHYERAGNAPKAVDYLLLAGNQAGSRSAYAQELEYLNRANALTGELPSGPERISREYEVIKAIGYTLTAVRGGASPELEPVHSRLEELCAERGDRRELPRVLSGIQQFHNLRLELAKAFELGKRAVDLAEQSGDRYAIGQTNFGLAQTLFFMGQQRAALGHYQKATAGSAGGPRDSARVMPGAFSGVSLWILGYPQQALERCLEARSNALDLRVSTRGFVLAALCFVRHFRREPHQMLEESAAAVELAAAHGLAHVAAYAAIHRGWAVGVLGECEKGIAEMRRGFSIREDIGITNRPNYLAMLAELYCLNGQHRESLEALDEAIAVVEKTGDRCYEAPILVLKGEIILMADPDPGAEARALFDKAIEVARSQEAKSWELHATTSLARLLAKQGKRDEARAMLAEIYNWFTEGFDSADLKDAKALLDELSS